MTEREYADFSWGRVEHMPNSHRYALIVDKERELGLDRDRIPVPSVTGALGILEKPDLLPWAEAIGAEGAAILYELGELEHVEPREVVDVVRLHKLGIAAKRDAGAQRGTAIHQALHDYHKTGQVPKVSEYDMAERRYISALCDWLIEADPTPVRIEQIVGSPKHEYAGRFDLLAEIDSRLVVVDLKTGKRARTYPAHHLQIAGYIGACEECEIDVHDGLVLAIGEDGEHCAQPLVASPESFYSVLACQRAFKAVKASLRAAERIAA